MTLTIYGTSKSRALRVLWLLEELGLPYAHDPLPPRAPALRAMGGTGKIPALMADGALLGDSLAILHHLADREGRFTHPAGSLPRARQDGWTFRVLDEIEGPLWTVARHGFALPEPLRVPAAKDSARAEWAAAAERLAADLPATPFLAGEDPTVPDILLAHCTGWAKAARFPPAPDALIAHRSRMTARPAYARAIARG